MSGLRLLLSVPFRICAVVSGALGVALVAFSIGLTLMAEVVAE